MPGKAVIGKITDTPDSLEENTLRYSFQVCFFSTTGLVAAEYVDVVILPTETISQIKTKVRQAMITRAAVHGLSLSAVDVSSMMQI